MENLVNLRDIKNTEQKTTSKLGKLLIGITGGFGIALTVICGPFVSPALRKVCLPYVPATDAQLRNVLSALGPGRGRLLDVGSGDGRIVIETAKRQFESDGVELNAWLVLYSKLSAYRQGANARFFRRDLWKYDLSPYDNVVIFGVEQMMDDLEKKFVRECRPRCRIVACRFALPNMVPVKTIGSGVDTVWLYEIEERK